MFLSEIHPKIRKELHRREFILKRTPGDISGAKIKQTEELDSNKENRDLLAESFAKSPWVRVFSPLDSRKVVSNKWKRQLQIERMELPEFGQSNRYFKGGDKAKVWEDFKNGLGHDGGNQLVPNLIGGYNTVLLQSGLMYRDEPTEVEVLTDATTWTNQNKMYTGLSGVYGRNKKSEDPMSPINNKGDEYESFTGHGVLPIPGIKSISINYVGEMKASKEATIEWVCWSFKDLQLLTPHFLEMGKLVTLEWGWGELGGTNKPIPLDYKKILNASTTWSESNKEGRTSTVSLYEEIQGRVFENGGNYDAMVGVISNFEWSLRDDGGFDCTTNLKSRGVNIINQSLGSPSNTTGIQLGTIEEDDDDKNTSPQLTFDKFIDQMLEQIKEIAKGMKFDSKNLKKYWASINIQPKGAIVSKEAFVNFIQDEYAAGTFPDDALSDGIFWPVAWVTGVLKDKQMGPWISWGWIEDNVLSRFLGKVDIHGNLMQEFRSVDAVYKGKEFIGYEPTKISNHSALITVDPGICIIPGQYPLHLSNWEGTWISDDPWGYMAKFVDDREGNTPFTPPPFRAYKWQDWGSTEKYGGVAGNKAYWVHPSKTGFNWVDAKGGQSPSKPGEYLRLLNSTELATPFESIREAGYMRHLLIHYETFKDAFEGVDSVEAACQSLFNKLNSTTGIWDLHLTTDGERVKVVDRNYTEEKVKTLLDEPSVWGTVNKDTGVVTEYGAKELKDDKILPNGKVYIFPSWGRSSMVNSQTLSAKLPESAAVTAMYGGIASPGANPPEGGGDPADFLASSALQSTIDPTQKNIDGAWEKGLGKTGKFGTQFPYNLKVKKGKWEKFGVDNGFLFDVSLVAGVKSTGGKQTSVDLPIDSNTFVREALVTNLQLVTNNLIGAKSNLTYNKEISDNLFINIDQYNSRLVNYNQGWTDKNKQAYNPYVAESQGIVSEKSSAGMKAAKQILKEDMIVTMYNPITGKLKNTFPHAYVDAMKYLIGVNRATSIFGIGGSSPMLKMELELEIQGIGGIVPGNAFNVSMLPSNYEGKVIFQVVDINQELSDTGWKTTLTGQMRVNISEQSPEDIASFLERKAAAPNRGSLDEAIKGWDGTGKSHIPGYQMEDIIDYDAIQRKKFGT